MAISHADHDHPNTPAARAKCRATMKKDGGPVKIESAGVTKPAQSGILATVPGGGVMTVVPRRRGDGGVVKGMQATAPVAATRRLKVSGSKITNIGHLTDVPRELACGARQAWARDWDVVAGHPFNDDERRIVIHGEVAEIALVWDSNGRTAVFVRSWDSSITRRVDSHEEAFTLAASPDNWPWRGEDGRLL